MRLSPFCRGIIPCCASECWKYRLVGTWTRVQSRFSISHWFAEPADFLSTSAGGSALGSSQPSCRPWERGDVLRRLSTFKPANWFGKPKAASSLNCARRGWVNFAVDKIECESCGANLQFVLSAFWTPTEGEGAAEDFAKQLDATKSVVLGEETAAQKAWCSFLLLPHQLLLGVIKIAVMDCRTIFWFCLYSKFVCIC